MSQPPPLPPPGGSPPVPVTSPAGATPPPVPGRVGAAVPATGSSNGKRILLWGCGILSVLALLMAISLGVLGYLGYKKAKEAGIDFQKDGQNQTLLTAKLLSMMNPDFEVLSADDKTKIVTIKVKSTGQTVTMNLQDMQSGKMPNISVAEGEPKKQEDGAVVSTTTSTEVMETPAPEVPASKVLQDLPIPAEVAAMSAGTLQKFPSWMPVYSGGKTLLANIQVEEGTTTGMHTLMTTEAAAKVAAFYEEKFKEGGLTVEKQEMAAGEQWMTMLSAHSAKDDKKAEVAIIKDANGVTVSATYTATPTPAEPLNR